MKNRVRQFWDHACKVYRLDAFLKRYRDFRCNPRVSSATIIALLILGIASRIKSFYQLERMGMNGEFAKAIRGEKPSADPTFTLSVVNRYTGEQNSPRKHAEIRIFLYIFLAVMLTIC